jgi:glycosyltransferase involved in cell wall biosynthesis
VIVTAEATPPSSPYPVRWVSRALPPGLRHAAVVRLVVARARKADVVYATSMSGRTALGASLARAPYVLKVTSDPAFERARRRGLVAGATSDFQAGGGGPTVGLLRRLRDRGVRRAAHVVCPSSFMRDLVVSWGCPADRVSVLPNPAPDPREATTAPVCDESTQSDARPALVFAGRLTAAKNLDVALTALVDVPDATLLIAGDGEQRVRLAQLAVELGLDGRVRFLGSLPRGEVLALLGEADVAVLSSAWENFPHAAVEALAMGTPVVATRVGGVPEVVVDGENGLLVEPRDPTAFAEALRRIVADNELRARLAAAAAPSVRRFATDEIYGRLERILEAAA